MEFCEKLKKSQKSQNQNLSQFYDGRLERDFAMMVGRLLGNGTRQLRYFDLALVIANETNEQDFSLARFEAVNDVWNCALERFIRE